MPINVVLGEQRGDEGKGRFVDLLAERHTIVARFNGGPNAGHTIVLPDGNVLGLHLIPSGIAHNGTINIIGNGTYINPIKLVAEINSIKKLGIPISPKNLKVSNQAHVILPHHITADEIREASKLRQGSTKSGIAPVSSDKYARLGFQMGDFVNNTDTVLNQVKFQLEMQTNERNNAELSSIDISKSIAELKNAASILNKYIIDTVLFLNERLETDSTVLAEGAQAFWLDIDHGMYPYVTSSHTGIGSVLSGLGIGPKRIKRIIGVSKLTPSHVGDGPFVTEIKDVKLLNKLHGNLSAVDAETGTTTGRVRRLGYFDIPMLKRAQITNETTEIALTKLDWLPRYGKEVMICTQYRLDGRLVDIAPSPASKLEQCVPVYQSFPVWSDNIDLRNIRSFSELPPEAQEIIVAIEHYTGKPVIMIGVGPGRDEVIIRKH